MARTAGGQAGGQASGRVTTFAPALGVAPSARFLPRGSSPACPPARLPACAIVLALAVAGCSSTEENQPRDTSWTEAEGAYLAGEWSVAIPAYDRFITSHSGDSRIVHARLRVGRCYLALNRPAAALPLIDQALSDAPDARFRADAHSARGLAQHMLGAPEKAEAEFLEAIRIGEGYIRKDEVLYYLGVCRIRRGDWDDGLADMGAVIREAPESPYAAKARSIRSSGVRAFSIQVGAFGDPGGARRRADELRAKGYDSEIVPEGTLNCVRTGRYATWGEATEAARALETVTGFDTAVVP